MPRETKQHNPTHPKQSFFKEKWATSGGIQAQHIDIWIKNAVHTMNAHIHIQCIYRAFSNSMNTMYIYDVFPDHIYHTVR